MKWTINIKVGTRVGTFKGAEGSLEAGVGIGD